MNKIEKLIAEMCPDGVEFKALREVGKLIGGSGLPKADFTESGVGCIHYGQIYTYYGIHTNQTISFVSEESATKLKRVKHGDIIIAKTSENVEDVCKSVAYIGADKIVTGGHTAIFKHKQNPKYISYYINGSKEFQIQKKKMVIGVKVIDVSLKNLAKIKIPIPPLAIQKEIVKILDNFTELETELEAELETELEARKRQYEYYLSKLIIFKKHTEYAVLGEVAILKYGFTAKANKSGTARFIRITDIGANGYLKDKDHRYIDIDDKNKDYLLGENDLLMARTGATFGKTLLVCTNEPAIYASFLIKIKLDNTKILNKYYWHFAKTNLYWDQANSYVSSGGQPQFNGNVLKKIKIPIPSLTEQKRIVSILDKFDALVNDISIGLPAEIAARKKQYEYYRNQLLTFTPLIGAENVPCTGGKYSAPTDESK